MCYSFRLLAAKCFPRVLFAPVRLHVEIGALDELKTRDSMICFRISGYENSGEEVADSDPPAEIFTSLLACFAPLLPLIFELAF